MTHHLSIIVAMAQNRAIGFEGGIPWHIPDDLKKFKERTLGHPCIMGRKTFESIVARLGKPLPGRTSIVISRSGFDHTEAPVFPTLEEAFDAAAFIADRDEKDEIFICGGAEIYKQALPIASRLYLTEVDLTPQADVFFPMFSPKDWREVAREEHAGHPGFRFLTYERP